MNTKTITELLNTDFCPWANRYVYWLKKPLGILLVAGVASLLCGLFVAPQGLVIAGAIAATIVLGIIWPSVGLRGLSCELRFPVRRGVEGHISPVEVIVRNRWPFPVWGLAIDDGFFHGVDGEEGIAVALSGIRGWSKTRFSWNFQPECRGVYPTTKVWLSTEFPFGVWKARREIDVTEKLVVWPNTVSLAPAVLADGANRSLMRPSDKNSGNEGERIGVRAYREGDSLRFVHWAQTAKCDRLIVSERQGPAQSSAVIAIDTDPTIVHGEGPWSSLETSIRIAASLCEQLTRQNVIVWMAANSDVWEVQPTDLSRRRSLDRLAKLAGTAALPLNGFGMHEARFVITTAAQTQDWGPNWKSIVIADLGDASTQQVSVGPLAWIRIKPTADALQQFVRCWQASMRGVWRGTERRLGMDERVEVA